MKRILCYGDSNTWGHIPLKGTRYAADIRWSGVMADVLGADYRVIEDSISGRTTLLEDPVLPNRCGKDNLGYSLLAHSPIDLMILALGTNDLKFTDAVGIRRNISRMIDLIRTADEVYYSFSPIFAGDKKILLVAPPHILEEIEARLPKQTLSHAAPASRELSEHYSQIAHEKGVYFLDASLLVKPSLEDCVHLTPSSHSILGNAIASEVLRIFGN